MESRLRGHAWLSLVCLTLSGAVPAATESTDPPSDPLARLARAVGEAETQLEAGETELAESRYRTALQEGWLLLGALAAVEGDAERAEDAFERAASSAANDRRPLLARALLRVEVGRPSDAIASLRRLAARDPADVEVRQSLARALAAAGSFDEAIQELEETLVLAPDDLEIAYSLATAYLRRDRPEAAEPLLERLAAERPIPQTHVLIGRTYRDHGLYDRAREALQTALQMDPTVRRAHYYLGTTELLAEGRYGIEEAIRNFRAELEREPDDSMTQLYLGIALVETRRYEESLAPLEAAARSAAQQRDAHQFLGRAYLALDRTEEAIVHLRRALELAREQAMQAPEGVLVDLGESQISSLHYQLAQALRRTGRSDEAATHFDLAREHSAKLAESSRETLARYLEDETSATTASLGPPIEFAAVAGLEPAARRQLEGRVRTDLARAYLNLGVLKSRAGRFAGAARLFGEAADLAPELPGVHYSLGVALFNAGRFADAAPALARALDGSEDNAELRRMLALAHLNSEAYEAAADLLRDDGERRSNPSLEYAYGLALVRSGHAAEAEEVFAGLLRNHGRWPELHVVQGQALARQGDYEAAVRSLRRALELQPRVAEAHATLGDIFLRQGRLAEAEQELRAELAAHPGDQRSRYTLAMVLDLNRKPEEAKRVLREHLAARPGSADGRYLLGKILLAEGAAEDALEQLEAAAALAPEDANVRYQLGQALQKLGRTDEAAREFERFRELKAAQREEPS